MRIHEVKDILNAEVLCGEALLETDVKVACSSDLMSHVLTFVGYDNALLLTGLTTPQVIYVSDAVDILAVCFVRGKRPEEEPITLARERNMVLLATELPTFEACGKLYSAGLRGGEDGGEA